MAEEKDKAAKASEAKAPGLETAAPAAPAGEAAKAELAAAAGAEGTRPARGARGKATRHVPFGIAFITASFNNTMITITDTKGSVLVWSSAGRAGFKGSRKSTAFAASVVGQDVARQAVGRGMREVEVRVQGPGAGRESAIRALQSAGLSITVIKDMTPMPHNGCRPRKRRRV